MQKQADPHPLRRWRKDANKTLADLSTDAEVTPSHLSEIERGVNGASLPLAVKLNEITGLPIESFVKKREGAQ